MARKPEKVTICTDCKRENVGVMLDWTNRNGVNEIIPRYRMARHKVKFKADDKSVPYCVAGRSLVKDELVFDAKYGA